MSEREADQQPHGENEDDDADRDVAQEIEDDPSTAGSPDEPGDELRGG